MKITNMFTSVFICLLLAANLGLADDPETSFQKDLSYYQRMVKQKNLNINDRRYLLERIIDKYDGEDLKELAVWKEELEKLKMGKSGDKEPVQKEGKLAGLIEQKKEKPEAAGLLAAGKDKKDYIISIGDLLGISVSPTEEFNRDVIVQPDGNIALSLIGKIMAAGLTVERLAGILTKKLSFYVSNPQVSVIVKRFSQRSVFVLGEVARPGAYEYGEELRLWQLITHAGGLTDHAVLKPVKIYRGKDSEREVILIDLGEKEKSKDFLLEVGDIVDIPRGAKEIYLFGEVNKPGSYEHKEKLKVVELVSLAGGTSPNAVIRKIRIFRESGGKRQVFTVNLSEILDKGRLDKDIELKPGDIVYVPQKGAAKGAAWLNNFLPWISMVNFILLLVIYF
ncbi:MAG: SLBB domain-containing protein [Elusimicrobiota bacterium]